MRANYPYLLSRYMAGRQPCVEWCPAIPNNGELSPVAAISEPPAEIGEKRPGRPRVTQRNASIRSRLRLTATGDRRNGGTEVPLTKGIPREQCRRRPQGRNGCEEDDRSSDPRIRSAPTERQASVGCENFLQNPQPLVHSSPAAAPRSILPVRRSIADPANRPSHENPLVEAPIRAGSAPVSRSEIRKLD